MGMTERPSTTDISTLTLSMFDDMETLRDQRRDLQAFMVSPPLMDEDSAAKDRMVEWRISEGLIEYPQALAAMEERAAAIASGAAPELVWLLEHPPSTPRARARRMRI